ncbi:MAG: HlyD family efflux transporter periplasmic adaptor subunit [Lachnospiraceae bacterium]
MANTGTYNNNNRRKTKRSRISFGFMLLVFILIYLIAIIISQANKSKIYSYQVLEGSLAVSSIYTGIAIRDEIVYNSTNTGYINYFAREGEHVGVGDLIYTIDESGAMDELLNSENGGDNTLSNEDLADLKSEIIQFSSNFDPVNFSDTYDFLYSMDGNILKLTNMQLLSGISDVNRGSYSDLIQLNNCSKAGYVVYNVDGYENLTLDSIQGELFEQTDYEKEQLINNSLVGAGDVVYKIIPSEEWSIVIPLEEERALELQDEDYVKIRFLSNQLELWAEFQILQKEDGYYGVLTMNKSMVSFCTERFIDIELITSPEQGLKIPLSSIVYKQFYLVPVEYAVEEGENNTCRFSKKIFLEDGTVSTVEIEIEVYAKQDGYYYVDDTQLKPGDYLILPILLDRSDGTNGIPSNASSSNPAGLPEENRIGVTSSVSDDSVSANNSIYAGATTTVSQYVGGEVLEDTESDSAVKDLPQEYAISQKGQLVGVYNMNYGYADFKQVNILYQNEEYAIVKSNTAYGLNVYDYIVLEADMVDEDDFVYE